ncbi:MAG TPA: hypothetical protein VIV14_08905 [Gammaproteobacteria bacterium]
MRKIKKTHGSRKTPVISRNWERDPLILRSIPTKALFVEESGSLKEKYSARRAWMEERGLDIRVTKSGSEQSTAKRPLPGAIIYFSSAKPAAA